MQAYALSTAMALAISGGALAQPVLVPIPERGSELLINTTTAGSQEKPAVSALSKGGFVAAWHDRSGPDWDVRAQRFDIDADRQGAEFVVNTSTDDDQQLPDLAALPDGGFVVVWTDYALRSDDDSCGFDILTTACSVRAQLFDADGSPRGAELRVNTATTAAQYEPAVAPTGDGGFVVAWTDASQSGNDSSELAVRGQRFDATGAPLGTEFLINTTTMDRQGKPEVAALAGGGFLVAWEDSSRTGGDQSFDAIRAQRFDADGTALGGELLVNTTTSLGQRAPAAAGLIDGGFVIAWDDNCQCADDSDGKAIRAQIFDADGSQRGGEIRVNTVTTKNQGLPSVASLDDGGFAVTWEDASQQGSDSDGTAIKAQVFDADGIAWGGEYLVNTSTTMSQDNPDAAGLVEGGFIVAWEDSSATGGDTHLAAIRGQIYSGFLFADGFEG